MSEAIPATPEPMPTPANSAKAKGMKCLKVYGGIYVVLIVMYAVHLFTGSMPSAVADLKIGDRFWQEFTFEHAGNKMVLEPGVALNALTADLAREGALEPDVKVLLFKPTFFHNLNWERVFGVWNVLGLVLVLYTLLGDPLPTLLDTERARIAAELEAARAAKAEAQSIQQQRDEMLRSLEEEKLHVAELAREEAAHEKQRIIDEAKADSERMLETLQHHIDASVKDAAKRLAREVAHEAVAQIREEFSAEPVAGSDREQMMSRFVSRIEETKLS